MGKNSNRRERGEIQAGIAERAAKNGTPATLDAWRRILCGMIFGAHVLFYSQDPEADRAFFSDVLALRSVDVGHGWLIFGLPPAEAAIHPADREFSQTHAGAPNAGSGALFDVRRPEGRDHGAAVEAR
jgi:hypothetical protein